MGSEYDSRLIGLADGIHDRFSPSVVFEVAVWKGCCRSRIRCDLVARGLESQGAGGGKVGRRRVDAMAKSPGADEWLSCCSLPLGGKG